MKLDPPVRGRAGRWLLFPLRSLPHFQTASSVSSQRGMMTPQSTTIHPLPPPPCTASGSGGRPQPGTSLISAEVAHRPGAPGNARVARMLRNCATALFLLAVLSKVTAIMLPLMSLTLLDRELLPPRRTPELWVGSGSRRGSDRGSPRTPQSRRARSHERRGPIKSRSDSGRERPSG
jgi:hypothetical protein